MRRVLVGLLLVTACRRAPERAPDPCPAGEAEGPLTWIRDDYAGALACAKRRHVPLVLDLWAPWCHTCLSMQSTVLRDPSFGADAPRFVFASLDTDRDGNAGPLQKLAISAWPTFYVVGGDETVMARFVGAASVAQFHAFLDAGARAGAGGVAAADAHLLSADRAMAVKDLPTADIELTAALGVAPPDWSRRPDALASLVRTKEKRGDVDGCLQMAGPHMAETGHAAAASDYLVYAMMCADDAERAGQLAAAGTVRRQAVARWQQLLADPAAQLSIDDRSDAMASLRDAMAKLGDHAGATAIAEQQAALLDAAAAEAGSPYAAMTYNWPRAEVYAYLGRGAQLVPVLQKSAADLPKEYDPPARLGWLLYKMGRFDEAAIATETALGLAYGPRKARLESLRADIAAGAGDKADERTYRRRAVDEYEHLPKGEENPDGLAAAKAALAATNGAGSAT